MGDCTLFHDEIRFSVRDPEKTEVWVYLRGEGDCPFQCIGWRYKAFPPSVKPMDILVSWSVGDYDPLDWERKDPPPTELNYNPDWDAIEADILARLAERGAKADE
jgi:hypothetical protein